MDTSTETSEPTSEPAPARTFTVLELLYAASTLCTCGAGMAYPLDTKEAFKLRAWVCSRVLLGEVEIDTSRPDAEPNGLGPIRRYDLTGAEHIGLPWWCYSVKSEGQPSAMGATTRPAGTHVETEPRGVCKCGHTWTAALRRSTVEGRQRSAGLDCPKCGAAYLNPDGSTSGAVDARFRTVVVADEVRDAGA